MPDRPSKAGAAAFRQPEPGRWDPVVLAAALWVLVYLGFNAFNFAIGARRLTLLPVIWCLHGFVLTWPLYFLIERSRSIAPWVRWPVVAVGVVVTALVQTAVDVTVSRLYRGVPLELPGERYGLMYVTPQGMRDIGNPITMMIYFWVFAFFAVATGLLLSQRGVMRARAAAHKAELAALRLQLNPHFLFNSLNSISALIVTGRTEQADTATQNLAGFLRGALTADISGLVRLEQEAASAEAYLEMERVRFGDRLRVEFDLPDDLADTQVPDFLLQPLVENAVKYAVAPARRPITVAVRGRRVGADIELRVENDVDPGAEVGSDSGTGVGLRNTRERLYAVYGGNAELSTTRGDEGFVATIRLPERPPRAAA